MMPTITLDPTPPKRMTRARAKAAEEKSKTAVVTTPAARAASKNKRKINEDGNIEGGLEQLLPPKIQTSVPAPVKSSLKPPTVKAAVIKESASSASNVEDQPAKPGRGRPRKAVDSAQSENAMPTKPATRVATRSTRAPPVVQASATKVEVLRKKVTFENLMEGKKNVVLIQDANKPGSATDTQESKLQGFKAKPIRAPTASVRRNKANQEAASQPLLPKKGDQTTQAAEPRSPLKVEASTPAKVLSKPPVKFVMSRTPLKPVSREAQAEERLTENTSATLKDVDNEEPTMILKSPAKRPPQSPFKHAMKESPKRIGTMPPPTVPVLGSGEPDFKDLPLLQRSPKKFNITQDSTGAIFKIPEKPAFKPSMFTSPARRPHTPLKGFLGGTPFKLEATTSVMSAMTTMGLPETPVRFQSSNIKSVSSSLKVSRTPSSTARVHKMSAGEMKVTSENRSRQSPAKVLNKKPATSAPIPNSTHLITPARLGSAKILQMPSESPACSDNLSIAPVESIVQKVDVQQDTDMLTNTNKEEEIATTPTGTPPSLEPQFRIIRAPSGPDPFDDDSDDELLLGDSRYIATPGTAIRSGIKPGMASQTPTTVQRGVKGSRISMTALAQRFNQWRTTSPGADVGEEQNSLRQLQSPTQIFMETAEPQSPLFNLGASPERLLFQVSPTKATTIESPQKSSFFEDAFVIMEDPIDDTIIEDPKFDEAFFRSSQLSAASRDYGDENMPIDPRLMDFNNTEIIQTCTPARVFDDKPRVVHTVTKIPLKPAADHNETPFKMPNRRSRSLSSPAIPNGQIHKRALREITLDSYCDIVAASSPRTLGTQTPRSEQESSVLKGAVVYVDVHTMEGTDASGIFVELLSRMGARCVKQWTWSPRSSASTDFDGFPNPGSSSKAGITHVVFKDGGKRTMEKVREAGGTVRCVGVNWVLDCERENRWLDEASYAIDISTVPRGGRRRRKSMEPQALTRSSEMEGGSSRRSINPKEFFNLGSPTVDVTVSRTPLPSPQVGFAPSPLKAPETPRTTVEDLASAYATLEASEPVCFDSPTTPYFLHPQQLIQQTCPPKQTQQPLFPTVDSRNGLSSESIRERLLLARRKSLQFVPKVGSPLAKMMG